MKNNKIFTCILTASLLWLNTGANAEKPENSNNITVPESTTSNTGLTPVEPYNSKDLPKGTTNTTNDPAKEIMPTTQEATQTDNNPNNILPSGNSEPNSMSMPMPENTKQELNSDQNKEEPTLPTASETKAKKEPKFKSFFQKGDKSKK